MTIDLRPYQQKLKNKIYHSWQSGNRNVCAVLSTGGGKSCIISDIIQDGYRQGMSEAVIAHRNELVTQMSCHIAARGIPHRIIGSNETIKQCVVKHREKFKKSFHNPSARTAVVGVDTLIARRESLIDWASQIDRWTIDEFHHTIGGATFTENGNYAKDKNGNYIFNTDPNKWGKAVAMMPNAYGLGVTATPIRADGRGLGRSFDGVADDIVLGPSMRWLIENEYLAEYEIVCPTSDMQVEEEATSANGDWSPQYLKKAAKKSKIIGDVVENYIRWAFGRKAICFATDIETAGDIAHKFNEFGIRAAALSSETPSTVREKYLREFELGILTVLVNVDLFDEGFDCLSIDTEILTPDGWRCWTDEIKECYAWDSETGEAVVTPVIKQASRPLRDGEKFLEIESQHTSIKVTENHRIYYKDVNYYKYGSGGLSDQVSVDTAENIYNNPTNKFALPLNGFKQFKGISLSDDEIRILGWYMTDGYLCKKNQILSISQVKKKYVKQIKELLNRLGWQYREDIRTITSGYNPKGSIEHRFIIRKRCTNYLLPYMNKYNPPKILNDMTREQFKVLYEAMMDGNGSRQGNKSGTMTTMHKKQADFITAAASVRGYASMYGNYKTNNDVMIYSVRLRDSQWMEFYQKDRRGARFTLTKPQEREMVWCVTNKYGTLITRRNGRVVVLGNCPGAEVVIMARPTASLGKYLQQIGRVLRPYPGKIALIIDHVSNVIRHKLPDTNHVWTLARRDKRGKSTPDPEDIPLTRCLNPTCLKPYKRFLPTCPYCGAGKPLPTPRERSIEMVEGDLILLDREMLERMRVATELENPADIASRVQYATGNAFAAKGVANRQLEKIEEHNRLRDALAQWAGIQRATGLSDREIQKKFYLTVGYDVLSALDANKSRADMQKIREMIESWYGPR